SGNSQAKKSLGEVFFAKRDYQKAIGITDDILKASGQDTEALLLKGRILLGQNKVSEAIVQLQSAVKSNPNSVTARYYLGHAYLQAKNPKGAEMEWTEAVKTGGTFLLPHLALAQLKLDMGDKETAAKYARQALVVIPN